MIKVAFICRYSGEIELLKVRLEYLNKLQKRFIKELKLSQYITYSNHYWNLSEIEPKPSDQISKDISIDFFSEKCEYVDLDNSLSPRDNEDITLTALEKTANKVRNQFDWLIVSDLDEFIGNELLNQIINNQLPTNCFTHCQQLSMFYNSHYLYDERWPGPIVLHSSYKQSSIALAMYTRHLNYKRTSIVKDGVHASYFKSTLNMKQNSTHGLPKKRIKSIFSLVGIHPFLRSPSLKSNIVNNDINVALSKISYEYVEVPFFIRMLNYKFLRIINLNFQVALKIFTELKIIYNNAI